MNSKRLLCFLLEAALILQTPATAYAAETLTYEQYRGGSGYSSTIKEQDYGFYTQQQFLFTPYYILSGSQYLYTDIPFPVPYCQREAGTK